MMRISQQYKPDMMLARDGRDRTNANKGLKPGQVEGVEGLFVCYIVLRSIITALDVFRA
jgi:hypothetical protein